MHHSEVRIGAVACFTVSNPYITVILLSEYLAFRMNVAHSGRFLQLSMTQCQVSLLPVKIEDAFFDEDDCSLKENVESVLIYPNMRRD